ncbi:MAG: FKBP-type peptidyl-prolyl cis-trans isomerase [Candidatus Helarchaeota archaeon]
MSDKDRTEVEKEVEAKKDNNAVKDNQDNGNEEIVNRNDLVLIDIIGRIKRNNSVFITTIEEIAKKEEIYEGNENLSYEPQLVIAGEDFSLYGITIRGVSENLIGMKIGETKTITVPAENAFGERLAKNIKTYSMRKIKTVEKNPRPGKSIFIDNRRGIITRVDTRGRVKVDFNHPYAGLDVVYEVTVKEKITDRNEKIKRLFLARFPIGNIDNIKFELKDNDLDILIPLDVAFQMMRFPVMNKLTLFLEYQNFAGINMVRYIEVFDSNIFGNEEEEITDEEITDEEVIVEEVTIEELTGKEITDEEIADEEIDMREKKD